MLGTRRHDLRMIRSTEPTLSRTSSSVLSRHGPERRGVERAAQMANPAQRWREGSAPRRRSVANHQVAEHPPGGYQRGRDQQPPAKNNGEDLPNEGRTTGGAGD